VFSWVTEEVQSQILAITARQLTPHGIAYISYSCYPGWHMREMIRHMVRYHAERFDQPAKRIEQARALLDFLVGSVPADSGAYGQLLQSELELIRRCADSYLFHEHLEQANQPIYFHQFIERAEGWGLQYLAEADFAAMLTGRFPPEIAETLERISPDILHLEQYMDFVRNRLFRQTLLCHRNLALRRALNPALLHGLLAASSAIPEAETIDLSPGVRIAFRTGGGTRVETDSPVTKAAFALLQERWPCAIEIDALCLAALERVAAIISPAEREACRRALMQDLFQCYLANSIELRTWPPPGVNRITAKPRAYPLAVFQAAKEKEVVNVRHETISLDPFARKLMPALDGERDRTQLVD
jgi:methyltransferase-like protein